MFDEVTHCGFNSEAGWVLPVTPEGGEVVLFSSADGGV